MFRVKICGVTNREDALAIVQAGADAIGLNFYAESPRFCTAERAEQIVQSLPKEICKVGVFVNARAAEIRRAVEQYKLDLAQVHGDEPPEVLRELQGVPVMRAFRVDGDLSAVADYLSRCYRLASLPRMVLIDARQPGKFGGTGKSLDWAALAEQRAQLQGMPLVLAGGLTPMNVAEAIAIVRPWAVDTASGVAERPGKKSAERVHQFVETAKAAFSSSV